MESQKEEMGTDPFQVKSETIEAQHSGREPEVDLIRSEVPETNLSKLPVFKCDICGFETEYSNCYQLHLLLHTEIQTLKPVLLEKKPKYKCSICYLRIKTREELHHHQQTHLDVSTPKVFKCSLCSFQTKDNDDLMHHLQIHTEQEAPQLVHDNLRTYSRDDSHHSFPMPSYEISNTFPVVPDNYRKKLDHSEIGHQTFFEPNTTLDTNKDHGKPEIEKISDNEIDFKSRLESNSEVVAPQKPSGILLAKISEQDRLNRTLIKSEEISENQEGSDSTLEEPKVKQEKHEGTDVDQTRFMKAMELSKLDSNSISGIDLNRIFTDESKNNQQSADQLLLKLFKCELCNFQTKYKGYFRRHMQNHEKKGLFQCQSCSFQAKSPNGLSRHQLMHTTFSKICEVCGFEAKSEIVFKRHMQKHSTEANLDINDSLTPDADSELHDFESEYKVYLENNKEGESLKCPTCEFETKSSIGLKRHMTVHTETAEKGSFKCTLCGFESKTEGFLKRHLGTHMKEIPRMKCPLCPYETTKSNAMKKHELTHKNILEVEVFSCHMCSFKTKWSCALKRHVDGHVNDFLYKCTMCSYESKHKHAFNRHLLVHKDPSEVRMFSCSVCDFQTKRKKTLKVHLENHFTDKIYNCTVCPFKTKHKYILGRHMLVHQDKSNVEMFKCEECNFETKRKDTLKDHLIKHTLHKLENCYEVLIQ